MARDQGGKAKILPVRVAYNEPLPSPLSEQLNHIQWAFWNDHSDTPRLIEELKRAMSPGVVQPGDERRARLFFAYKRNVEPDESTARQIAGALSKSHNVFIDRLMPIGVEWPEMINEAFAQADFLILLLSPASTRSEWVRLYIRRALADGKLKIIPVRLAYHEPLPDDLAGLDQIYHLAWEGPETTPHVVDEIISAIDQMMAEALPQMSPEEDSPADHLELAITTQPNGDLMFVESTGETILVSSQRDLVDDLILRATASTVYDQRLATALFEILIPNELKPRLAKQQGLILTVDHQSAGYPWEMMVERAAEGVRRFATNIEIIRKFAGAETKLSAPASGGGSALVIGDTQSEFPEIPGAQKEAREVAEILRVLDLEVNLLIRPDSLTVIRELFSEGYRIIHLSGHGATNQKDPTLKGMPIGNGNFLTAREIAQLRSIPELVFINCAHLGRFDTVEGPAQSQMVPEMAASIVEEFIKMGVKAVVAAGWSIDDAAASVFATAFYRDLLAGRTFGQAVLAARRATFAQHPNTNTWCAYQCYGDPKFVLRMHPS
jgi:hypothetical protein